MKIVIDIPEVIYEIARRVHRTINSDYLGIVTTAITNGTPLPKGHGKLVDLDDVERNIQRWLGYIDDDMISRINYTLEHHIPILLGADEEVDNADSN